MLEIFYSKEEKSFRNLLTNEVLKMDYRDLVISSLNKTKENWYAVVFYPMANDENESNELIILNREIK